MKFNVCNKIVVVVFFAAYLFLSKPTFVFADIVFNKESDPGIFAFPNGLIMSLPNYVGGATWDLYTFGDSGHVQFTDVYASAGYVSGNAYISLTSDGTSNSISSNADIRNSFFCVSDKRIPNFCKDLKDNCEGDDYRNGCRLAIAKKYNDEMKNILQSELNDIISNKGLDEGKSTTAVEACYGDLACINSVLNYLQKDPTYSEGSNSSVNNGALSYSSVSELIKSKVNTFDSSPTNSLKNDPNGFLGKTTRPKVEVKFTSNGVGQSGSIMTATAFPSYFSDNSDVKKLYFTWYLKREGCNLTDPDKNNRDKKETDPGVLSRCDFDSDSKITENDWKIAAAKINISKSFNGTNADYTKNINSKDAGYTALPEIDKQKGDTSDYNVGWINGFLRNGNGDLYDNNGDSNDVPNCYVQAPKSGRIYELRETLADFPNKSTCPDGYHAACVSDQIASCKVFSATDPTLLNNFNACAVSSEQTSNTEINGLCSVDDDDDLKNFKASIKCSDVKNNEGKAIPTYPLCVKNDNSNVELRDTAQALLGVIVGTKPGASNVVANNDKMCSSVAKKDTNNNNFFLPKENPLVKAANESCALLQDQLINGKKDNNGNVLIGGNSNLEPKCSFKRSNNLCKHLFPILPKTIKTDKGNQAITGDGEFNIAEKKFWGANPNTPTTNGSVKDEAIAVGLGVDKFEWFFSEGDQIGVVVEGDSVYKTDHQNDNANQRMWAFSKNTCKALERMESNSSIDPRDPNNNTRGFYMDGNKGILTANIDLNDCLQDNLITPEIDNNSKLKIQLKSTPENPINDANGRGDLLNVTSITTNLKNPDGLLYKWSIQESREGSYPPIDTSSWLDITSALEKMGSINSVDKQGVGKKDFAINLNLPDSVIKDALFNPSTFNGIFYLKVRVDVVGTVDDGSQNASGEIVIRIKQQQNKIYAYSVSATDTGALSMLKKSISGQSLEICGDQLGMDTCYVSKHSIIGLEVPSTSNKLSNFSWTVNGNEMNCGSASPQCESGGDKMFIPILGNEGEAVNVVVKAIETKTNGKTESIEVSRRFVIGKTQLQISSTDINSTCSQTCLNTSTICPKYLGRYTSLMGGAADCSSEIWETREGNVVTLSAQGQAGLDWTIDGQVIPEFQNKNEIQLSVDKPAGSSYTIGLSSHLLPGGTTQLNNIRTALYKNWGVAPTEVVVEDQSASMQLNVVENPQTLADSNQLSFGASLITHLPEQIMFLLKITITSFALLISTGLLFFLIPEEVFKK